MKQLTDIDWSRPVETSESEPRPVRVLREAKGAIDYMVVKIEGGELWWRHPPGEYVASRVSGLIRGTLAVRNVRSNKGASPNGETI